MVSYYNARKDQQPMNLDMASAFAEIVKQEKLEDGTLLVYGKATDDSVDIDQQICDAGWLSKAMPEWFKTGGNIREQHSNIAAGVAKELDSKSDGYYISALVVDPVSIKKVETNVLKGFSIGIRSPRIVRDEKAANGRIIDGQIVEVSLVDRPANPNAKLMLAKSDKANNLIQVEELVEAETVKGEKMEHGDKETVSEKPSKEELVERYAAAKKALDEITAMCKEAGVEIEIDGDEDEAVEKKQYGESAEEESQEGPSGSGAEHELEEAEGKKKSVEGETTEVVEETPAEEKTEETKEDSGAEPELISDKSLTAIVNKAVKSAMDSVLKEVESLKSANEAATGTINKLEDELATAKTKAVAGGPKRSALVKSDKSEADEFLRMALVYRQKAAATEDRVLASGYKELASDFAAKAEAVKSK